MSNILLRIVFIIALIIAIALIALVLIRYTPPFFSYVSSASASLFNVFKKEALEIRVEPQTVVSGQRVILSWPTDVQESVSLTYACNDEYSLSYLGGSNIRMPIRCGEAFELGGKTGTVAIIPTLTAADTFNDIEVTVEQERTDGKRASGIAVITVTSGTPPVTVATSTRPSLSTTTPATSHGSTSGNTSGHTSTPRLPEEPVTTVPHVSGPANLTLSQPQYVNAAGPAVQFTVTNNGGSNSGTWEIRASLPNGDIFNSGILAGLPAGGSSLFTLNLGTVLRGNNTVRVTVDANNTVTESNENDNTKEVTFSSTSGSSGSSNGSRADLSVRVLSIGYIGSDIGIRFEIRNNGGTAAEDWRFEAELPTEDDNTFRSGLQPDLKPGEAIEYTLKFDNPESNGYATIEADSENDVRESDEDNNRIRFRVTN